MSVCDATWAMREFLKVRDEARAMLTARAVGIVLDEVLRHADELLDIIDEQLATIDCQQHPMLFRIQLTLTAMFDDLYTDCQAARRRVTGATVEDGCRWQRPRRTSN